MLGNKLRNILQNDLAPLVVNGKKQMRLVLMNFPWKSRKSKWIRKSMWTRHTTLKPLGLPTVHCRCFASISEVAFQSVSCVWAHPSVWAEQPREWCAARSHVVPRKAGQGSELASALQLCGHSTLGITTQLSSLQWQVFPCSPSFLQTSKE